MSKKVLNIKGMHCNSCTVLVKEALLGVKGVKDAKVDLKKATAEISGDDTLADKDLINAVKAEGYDATLAK